MKSKKKLKNKLPILRKIYRDFTTWVSDGVRKILLLLLAIFLLGQWLNINFFGIVSDKLKQKIDTTRPLKDNESARVTGDMNRRTIVEQQKGKETKVYVGVRKFEYTQLNDGNVQRKVKTKGFTFEPGLAIGAGEALRVGPDAQLIYWNKFGLNLGFNVPARQRTFSGLRGVLSLTYTPYWKYFENTSIWGGVDTNKSPQAGLRWKF